MKIKKSSINKLNVLSKKFLPKKLNIGKKKSVWKKIILTVGSLGIIGLLPIVTLAAKSNDPFNTNLFREISLENVNNNVEYTDLNHVNIPYGELIRGTTKYNDGNYVLYLGTEACSHCAQFLYGNPDFDQGTPPLGNAANNASWKRGIWGQGISFAASNIKNPVVKFMMFEDKPVPSYESTSDRKFTLPWAKESSDNLTSGIVNGQYIRNDQSALEFREIFAFAKSQNNKIVGTPTVLAYKKGIVNFYNMSEPAAGTSETPPANANPETPAPSSPNAPETIPPTPAPITPPAVPSAPSGTSNSTPSGNSTSINSNINPYHNNMLIKTYNAQFLKLYRFADGESVTSAGTAEGFIQFLNNLYNSN